MTAGGDQIIRGFLLLSSELISVTLKWSGLLVWEAASCLVLVCPIFVGYKSPDCIWHVVTWNPGYVSPPLLHPGVTCITKCWLIAWKWKCHVPFLGRIVKKEGSFPLSVFLRGMQAWWLSSGSLFGAWGGIHEWLSNKIPGTSGLPVCKWERNSCVTPVICGLFSYDTDHCLNSYISESVSSGFVWGQLLEIFCFHIRLYASEVKECFIWWTRTIWTLINTNVWDVLQCLESNLSCKKPSWWCF